MERTAPIKVVEYALIKANYVEFFGTNEPEKGNECACFPYDNRLNFT
jgi:hypothetical protein